jgi:multisubunit Na+/H+ antiporter MnhE subunit
MRIPVSVIAPFYIVSFVLLAFQYFRVNPEKRLANLHFGLMAGAIVLMLAAIFLTERFLPLIFFALALVWLGLSVYLLRSLQPPGP